MKKILMFETRLRKRDGKVIPYTDEQPYGNDDDSDITDKSLHWFHEGYGKFQLYRLHQIDDSEYYICEPLKKFARTSDEDWNELISNPELALV